MCEGNERKSPAIQTPLTGTIPSSEFPWGQPPRNAPTFGRRTSTAVNTSRELSLKNPPSNISSEMSPNNFKFPPSPGATFQNPQLQSTVSRESKPKDPAFLANTFDNPQLEGTYTRNHSPQKPAHLNRVFSLSSQAGSPRSSTEVGSASNQSEDTNISEYASNVTSRLLGRNNPRQPSQLLAQNARRRFPETLMMGFAQVSSHFTLDESLVNQTPFEEVKQRAALGSQAGGGVVGFEKPKAGGNLFGFSWGNIGESLGGLLKPHEPSSIREVKGVASSKSIPLLSTPKSILFVDLKLGPGESRDYRYKFKLPRGLPPSHKGRAIRVVYNLVVGLQRPGQSRNSRQQQIRNIEVPFRVFCGVNQHGESLGHDLMSPYIVLKDSAQVESLEEKSQSPGQTQTSERPEASAPSTEADFNDYVSKLLDNPRRNSTSSLLSPTAETETTVDGATTNGNIPQMPRLAARDLIENAIRYSTQPMPGGSSTASAATSQTQFTIARAGQLVAQLAVSRPALRLGDTLQLFVDFPGLSPDHPNLTEGPSPPSDKSATLPVFALAATLESSENVDPALAIRSRSSIERATRRVWDRKIAGGANGMALGWSRRWTANLKVPTHATPGFTTTGVGLAWYVRVELVVEAGRLSPQYQRRDMDEYDPDEEYERERERELREEEVGAGSYKTGRNRKTFARRSRADILLEATSEDERGSLLAAARRLGCECFEVMVPVRVFGAAGAVVATRYDDYGGRFNGDEGLAV